MADAYLWDKPIVVTDLSACCSNRAMTDCVILSSPAHLRGKKEVFIKKLKIFRDNPKVWILGAVKKYRQAEKFLKKSQKYFV